MLRRCSLSTADLSLALGWSSLKQGVFSFLNITGAGRLMLYVISGCVFYEGLSYFDGDSDLHWVVSLSISLGDRPVII